MTDVQSSVSPKAGTAAPKKAKPAASPKPNGATESSQPPAGLNQISPKLRQSMQSKLLAANFGNIVTVLMQSPAHKNLPLSELTRLVTPPLLANQFSIAETHRKNSGFTIPVGLVLWARVSEDVDQQLSESLEGLTKIAAEDWTSGDILWLIEVLGDKRVVPHMLQDLKKSVFKGKTVKYRTVNDEGEPIVGLIEVPAE